MRVRLCTCASSESCAGFALHRTENQVSRRNKGKAWERLGKALGKALGKVPPSCAYIMLLKCAHVCLCACAHARAQDMSTPGWYSQLYGHMGAWACGIWGTGHSLAIALVSNCARFQLPGQLISIARAIATSEQQLLGQLILIALSNCPTQGVHRRFDTGSFRAITTECSVGVCVCVCDHMSVLAYEYVTSSADHNVCPLCLVLWKALQRIA